MNAKRLQEIKDFAVTPVAHMPYRIMSTDMMTAEHYSDLAYTALNDLLVEVERLRGKLEEIKNDDNWGLKPSANVTVYWIGPGEDLRDFIDKALDGDK